MPTRYIQRLADLRPNDISTSVANAIFVDSDDDQLKFTTGSSGSTTVDVVTETQTQTLTNKTLGAGTVITTEPTGAGAVVRVGSTMQANAQAVDHHFFIADRAYSLVAVREIHSTAGTDAGAVTLDVKKCTGTQAPSAGTTVLTATFNLKGTADTVNAGTIVATTLAVGDRLAVDITGTTTSVAGVNVSVVLQTA